MVVDYWSEENTGNDMYLQNQNLNGSSEGDGTSRVEREEHVLYRSSLIFPFRAYPDRTPVTFPIHMYS